MPDDIHRILKARAALAGMSLSDYALAELRRTAESPTQKELLDQIRRRTRPDLPESAADAVRAERDSR